MLSIGTLKGYKQKGTKLIKLGGIISYNNNTIIAKTAFDDENILSVTVNFIDTLAASSIFQKLISKSRKKEPITDLFSLWLMDKGNGSVVAMVRYSAEHDKLFSMQTDDFIVTRFHRLSIAQRKKLMADCNGRFLITPAYVFAS